MLEYKDLAVPTLTKVLEYKDLAVPTLTAIHNSSEACQQHWRVSAFLRRSIAAERSGQKATFPPGFYGPEEVEQGSSRRLKYKANIYLFSLLSPEAKAARAAEGRGTHTHTQVSWPLNAYSSSRRQGSVFPGDAY